jgi:hypothetical protein
MQESVTRKGTRIRHPAGEKVEERLDTALPGPTARRRAGVAEDDTGAAALLQGLSADPNVSLHDAFALAPAPAERRAEAGVPTEVEVEVGEAERAALLLERDGVYEWRLPEDREGQVRRRSGETAGRRRLLFRLDAPAAPARRGGAPRRGLIEFVSGQVADRLRAYVIKFVARTTVSGAARFLERNVKPGLVVMADDDPENWRVAPDQPSIALPHDRPARLLLFIHGTFSSTYGGFGALAVMPEGKEFLDAARKRYDAILAFDHATLSESPEANAAAILEALQKLSPRPGSVVDIVAHSRGGLVARVLVERLLEPAGWPVKPEKVVFVGSTNGGTALADRENWKSLLDLYTNLAVAAGRGLAIFDAGAASGVITESVKTLGAFVQAIVDAGVTEDMTPGIAAMSPTGAFVRTLNGALTKPDAFNVRYYAIGSDFESKLFDRDDAPKTLPVKLMRALADFGVDSLMKESNDLVVDTEAMTQFGPRDSRLAASLSWAANAVIFHTNYFAQPAVLKALRAWLVEGTNVERLPVVAVDPLALPAAMDVREARRKLAKLPGSEVVVIDRPSYGYYVRTANYIRARIEHAPAGDSLAAALDLRETQLAERTVDDGTAPQKIGATGWVRIVNGRVIEAAPPALTVLAEAASTKPAEVPRVEDSGEFIEIDGIRVPKRGHSLENLVSAKPPRRGDLSLQPAADRETSSAGDGTSEATEVRCHFGAEMPESCPLSEPAELTITVSREDIEKVIGPTSAKSDAVARLDQPIVIEVRAKANCEVVGDATAELRVPAVGQPETYDFRIRGKSAGPAEVWVDARQGARRLTRMVLQPQFVASGKVTAAAVVDTRNVDPPLVELRIYESADRPDSPFSLRFVMVSRDLGINLDEETKRFSMAREPYVRSLYEKLEGDWGANNQDFQRFMRSLRAFGAELYTQLVPEIIRKAIWEHRAVIGAIQVISHEPFIPWEVLHVVEPGKPAPPGGNMFLAELGLVRWTKNTGWPPASLRLGRGRARHVVPAYADPSLELRGAARERQLLQELFDSVEVPADSDTVVDLISTPGAFDLLHFACHGSASEDRIWDASLLLSGHKDRATGAYVRDYLATTAVSQFGNLRAGLSAAPMIFLNACQAGKAGRTLLGSGGMAEAFIRAGAGLFVGSLWSVGDDTATTFASEFYQRLKSGETVTRATRAAREAAKQANEPTWLAYTVYGHPYARLSIEH